MDSAPEATSPQLPIGSTPRQESPTAAPAPNNSDRNNSDRAAATTSRRPLDWVSHEAKVESKVLHVRNLPPDVLKCHYEVSVVANAKSKDLRKSAFSCWSS
jgi:hypothetical protein